MENRNLIAKASFLLGLIVATLVSGCVVATREGYWDREHNRYWHEHAWVACTDRDPHCR